MRYSLIIGALTVVGCASAAHAQTTAESVNAVRDIMFEGTAAPACVVRNVSASNARNAALSDTGANAATVELSSAGFIDPATGVPRATDITLALPITCNSPHHLRIASTRGALFLAGAAAGASQFRNRIDFDVLVDWAGKQQGFNTASTTSVDLGIDTAATGNAAIRIAIPGGGAPLIAGSYSDALTILVEASS